jgi:predicted nucleic acid-binding protein
MKYLLDVSILLSGLWNTHSKHASVRAWLQNKEVVLCPLCELGFLRISSHPKAINQNMENARRVLEQFVKDSNAEWIPDDLPALKSHARVSDIVTDEYLVELAAKYGLKFATLDGKIINPVVELVQ